MVWVGLNSSPRWSMRYLLAVVFVIGSEAWQRLQHPGSIDGETVSVVAVLGLLINLVVA